MSYHHVIPSNTYSTRVRLGLRSELDWLEVGVLHRYLCMLLHSDQRVKYHLGPETEIGKKLKKQCFLVHVSRFCVDLILWWETLECFLSISSLKTVVLATDGVFVPSLLTDCKSCWVDKLLPAQSFLFGVVNVVPLARRVTVRKNYSIVLVTIVVVWFCSRFPVEKVWAWIVPLLDKDRKSKLNKTLPIVTQNHGRKTRVSGKFYPASDSCQNYIIQKLF